MAYLLVEKCESVGKEVIFPLSKQSSSIGRPSMKTNPDIKINDDFISKHHAEIIYTDDYYYIKRIENKNGTLLDGRPIKCGQSQRLYNNCLIGLALFNGKPRVELRFKDSEDTALADSVKSKQALSDNIDFIKIDEYKKEIWIDGNLVPFAKKEFDLFYFLYSNYGGICNRDEIIANVWPESKDPGAVSDAAIDQIIYRIREKLKNFPSNAVHIFNKKGFGYILE